MKAIQITEDELIKALREAEQIGVNRGQGLTVKELVASTEMSTRSVRDRLATLQIQGRLTVGRKFVTDISGRRQLAPCYGVRPAS